MVDIVGANPAAAERRWYGVHPVWGARLRGQPGRSFVYGWQLPPAWTDLSNDEQDQRLQSFVRACLDLLAARGVPLDVDANGTTREVELDFLDIAGPWEVQDQAAVLNSNPVSITWSAADEEVMVVVDDWDSMWACLDVDEAASLTARSMGLDLDPDATPPPGLGQVLWRRLKDRVLARVHGRPGT